MRRPFVAKGDERCFKCGRLVEKGVIGVRKVRRYGKRRFYYSMHMGNLQFSKTRFYHIEHFTYANGEPIFKKDECVVVQQVRGHGEVVSTKIRKCSK